MKKRLLSMLCLGVFLISLTACGNINNDSSNNNYTKGLEFILSDDGGSYSVSNGNSNAINVVIPSVYKGKPVTSIRENAFFGNSVLESISIPNSVTTIYDFAFYDCSSLEQITIPNSVTKIGEHVFGNCNSLYEMTLPFVGAKENGKNNTHFGYIFGATEYSLNDIYVPSSLKKVIISDSETVDEYAFYDCDSLENVELANSVSIIGKSAFEKCDSLKSLSIPFVGNQLIGTSNTSFHYIFGGIELVPSSLKNVIISDSKIINKYAFEKCESIESIILPNSLETLDDGVFIRCSSLKSIIIPKNVKKIGKGIFDRCYSLESIVVDEENKYYDSRENCNALIKSSTNALVAGCKKSAIPYGVEKISDWAFWNCTSLESIVIPESVTSIGELAFENCNSMISIVIPKSLVSINFRLVSNCSSLKYVYYTGTEEEWMKATGGIGFNLDDTSNAVIIYNYKV